MLIAPPRRQLDIELAALLDSLSLQQRIRVGPFVDPPLLAGFPANSDLRVEADRGKRASTHRIRHPYERRRELPSKYLFILNTANDPALHHHPSCLCRRGSLVSPLPSPHSKKTRIPSPYPFLPFPFTA